MFETSELCIAKFNSQHYQFLVMCSWTNFFEVYYIHVQNEAINLTCRLLYGMETERETEREREKGKNA
jgi:hypothetical protein